MLAIKFLNDQTGNLKKANYKYEVVVTVTDDDGKLKVIKIDEGEIKGHFRDSGYQGLVKKLSDQLQKEETTHLIEMFTQLEEDAKCRKQSNS
jgi:hypothetical protein